jgi:hypothetical protein
MKMLLTLVHKRKIWFNCVVISKCPWEIDVARPKHHFALRIPSQIMEDGVVLDAWPLERKHLVPKRCAESIKNTSTFERTTLVRSVIAQLRQLAVDSCDNVVSVNRHAPADGAYAIGDQARILGITFAKGDVIYSDLDVAAIVANAAMAGGVSFLLVKRLQLLKDHRSFAEYRAEAAEVAWQIKRGFRHASFWYAKDDDWIVVK